MSYRRLLAFEPRSDILRNVQRYAVRHPVPTGAKGVLERECALGRRERD